jgi:diguanylate cyclase (GGDEF)-like protein
VVAIACRFEERSRFRGGPAAAYLGGSATANDAFSAQAPLLTYPQLQNLLRIEFARARRYSYPLSCLVGQVDGLDRMREVHGSAFRDEVLRRVVRSMHAQKRASDSLGLYQERLALLLPHTPMAGAHAVAQRLRESIARESFKAGATELRVTLSVGLAAFQERGTIFFDSVLKAAEAALAQAVSSGGDRIETSAPAAGPAPA